MKWFDVLKEDSDEGKRIDMAEEIGDILVRWLDDNIESDDIRNNSLRTHSHNLVDHFYSYLDQEEGDEDMDGWARLQIDGHTGEVFLADWTIDMGASLIENKLYDLPVETLTGMLEEVQGIYG